MRKSEYYDDDEAHWEEEARRERLEELSLRKRDRSEPVEWLSETHETSRHIQRMAQRLRSLGSSFCATGNQMIGNELFEMGQELNVLGENVSTLAGIKVNQDYREAVQGTANVLKALVGGIKLAGDDTLAEQAEEILGTDVLNPDKAPASGEA